MMHQGDECYSGEGRKMKSKHRRRTAKSVLDEPKVPVGQKCGDV